MYPVMAAGGNACTLALLTRTIAEPFVVCDIMSFAPGVVVPIPTFPVAVSTVSWEGRANGTLLEFGMPGLEVMTRFPVPELATEQKIESSGDQQTPRQLLSAALALVVQVMPSGEVMTRLPVPELATAQKRESSGDQHTEFH